MINGLFTYLTSTAISDAGIKSVVSLRRLIWLDIARTRITDKSIGALSQSQSLRALDVEGTALTDQCVPALLKLQHLCYLNVEKTRISKAGKRTLEVGLPALNDKAAREKMNQELWG